VERLNAVIAVTLVIGGSGKFLKTGAGDGTRTRDVQLGKLNVD
jgi:hypothetical protein